MVLMVLARAPSEACFLLYNGHIRYPLALHLEHAMPTSFTTFNLDPALLRAIAELGFEEATPVQEQVIPLMLDEADEMLDMGFIEDVEFILDQVPTDRQSGLFSATIPPRIVALARRYMRAPERVTIEKEKVTVPQVRQGYYYIPGGEKIGAPTGILDFETPAPTT